MEPQALVEALAELDREVLEEYLKVADTSSHYERSTSSATLSVKDLNFQNGQTTFRHSTLLLEVLQQWRNLTTVMAETGAFLECVGGMRKAFRGLPLIERSLYGHMKTLLSLLVNTVENAKRDNSTECRFVTLLEVVLSYGKGWKPSEEVSRLWVRLMQRIPIDVPPVNFRRKAYRVLVSLAWVPSSKGLLEACSFEAGRQSIDPQKAPAKVKAHLDKIRTKPQPRYDCVNQVLDRLKDETDVCVAITSERDGMGKSTLAALVASHPSILRVFRVLWLNVKDEKLTYDTYTKYLDDLCEQLSMKLEWPSCVKRFEEHAFRKLREQAAMHEARDRMAEALLPRDENYLLIMDDMSDAEKVEWFRFNERQSIIVTTLVSNLKGVDWSVELGPMSEEECIDLFLSEANFPTNHVLGLTTEMSSVIRQCDCHPLTARTLARLYKLKQVTAGISKGMEELLKEMSALNPEGLGEVDDEEGGESDDGKATSNNLFDILSLLLGPSRIDSSATSILFVLCFAAMVVVFPDETPLDSVLLLWEQLMKSEPHAINEISRKKDATAVDRKKHAWLIAEGLTHMGVMSIREHDGNPWVQVHHKLYKEFAVHMAKEMDLADTYEKTVEQWNRAFVTAYFTERIEGAADKEVDDNSWEYAIEKLPSHVFNAKMFQMAETILAEEHFFRARIEAMGWDRAVDVHIDDCVELQRALVDDDNNSTRTRHTVSPVFDQTAAIVSTQAEGALGTSEASFIVEVSRALFKIGVALAENRYYDEAVVQFERAQNLLPQSQELRASILYGAGWTLLATNRSEKALKKIKASRKIMEEYVVDHVLYKEALQLQGEALVGECEYKEAADFFEETIEKLRSDSDKSKIELGAALNKKGRLHHMTGELDKAQKTFNECLNWKLQIGETSVDLASVRSALGDMCMERRNVTEARDHFERALRTLDSLAVDPKKVIHSLVSGKLKFLRNEFSGSMEALERARRALIDAPKLFMDQSAYDLRCIARFYQARGDLPTAIAILQESLVLTNERPYSLERASGLHELANCLIDQDEVNEGLISLEQSLEIRILKLGECVLVLDTLNAIGNVHLSLGAFEEALAVFEKVHELTRRISPDDVERIAGVLYSIGEVYDAQKDFTHAMAKFDECKQALERDRSSDHPHVAKALQRLGDVSVARKDLDAAYDYYCEALRIRKMHFDQRQLAETLHSIGVLTRKRKHVEAAREPLLDALEIRRKLDSVRETGQTLLEIGNLFRLQSEGESALSLFEKSLEVLDQKDDVRASVYMAMGHVKISLKRDNHALACYESAREIRVAAYGRDNIKTANVYRSLGVLRYLANQAEESLVCLNEYIRVIEMNDDNENEEEGDDVDYVLAVILMFDIHRANGKADYSKKLIEIAKEVCDESDEVKEDLPALIDMVDRRVELTKDGNKNKGLLSRLKLSGEAGIHLSIDPEEETLIRQIVFIDD